MTLSWTAACLIHWPADATCVEGALVFLMLNNAAQTGNPEEPGWTTEVYFGRQAFSERSLTG